MSKYSEYILDLDDECDAVVIDVTHGGIHHGIEIPVSRWADVVLSMARLLDGGSTGVYAGDFYLRLIGDGDEAYIANESPDAPSRRYLRFHRSSWPGIATSVNRAISEEKVRAQIDQIVSESSLR